jgi:hypothetical protein
MRTETILMALKERRAGMGEALMSKSDVDVIAVARHQGVWQGLGDAISIITEEARKEMMLDE